MKKIDVGFYCEDSRRGEILSLRHGGGIRGCECMIANLDLDEQEKYGVDELYAEYTHEYAFKVDRFGLDDNYDEVSSTPIVGEEIDEKEEDCEWLGLISDDRWVGGRRPCTPEEAEADAKGGECIDWYPQIYKRDEVYVDENGNPLANRNLEEGKEYEDRLFFAFDELNKNCHDSYWITARGKRVSDAEADKRIAAILKAEILRQATEAGIPEDMLDFDI